ncbi:hypothetical protein COOONC_04765 [Cooperia oncophora]
MSSTATQRTLLLALSGVSLAALFIWYLRSKKGHAPRRDTSIEDVKRNAKTENTDSTTRRVRESVVFKKRRIVPKPANSEPSPVSGVVSEKSNRDVTPEMTTALENEPVSNIDSSSTPLVNGIINSLEEGSPKAVKKTDGEEQSKGTEADKSASNEIQEEEEEEGICKKAVDLQLSLDVSHQAEPEAFSWSDEMERLVRRSLNVFCLYTQYLSMLEARGDAQYVS